MPLKPKEILPTVIGTVVTLTALVTVLPIKHLSVAGLPSAEKPKVCCASSDVQAKCNQAAATTTPS